MIHIEWGNLIFQIIAFVVFLVALIGIVYAFYLTVTSKWKTLWKRKNLHK